MCWSLLPFLSSARHLCFPWMVAPPAGHAEHFSRRHHKPVTWTGYRLVYHVLDCNPKCRKRVVTSGFPPTCSRGQRFVPVTSRQQQRRLSFTFTNRGIKRDRSQTNRAAPGSFTAPEPPLGSTDRCPDNLMSLCQAIQYSVWSVSRRSCWWGRCPPL